MDEEACTGVWHVRAGVPSWERWREYATSHKEGHPLVIGGCLMEHRAERKRGEEKFWIVLFFIIISVPQLFTSSKISAHPLMNSATVDLDKDSTIDDVSLSDTKESGEFVLNVNRISRKGKLLEGRADGFLIVDIDATDRYEEIAVHT
ncbi:MAG: hypothetical protein HKM29_02810, partial [Deltaproteobacteria bacterium]|nr:hypothetical protein [Deltaproteobacteria bacterium]